MNKDTIDAFFDSEPIDYDFEEESDNAENYEHVEAEVVEEYTPPDYLIKNSIALYSQLAQIMAVYYHAKHGEPLSDVFENTLDTQYYIETPEFHL